MKVVWSERALADLDRIEAGIVPHSRKGAARIWLRVTTRVEGLAEFPKSCPLVGRAGLRKAVVSATPYIVLYRVRDGQIEIRAVVHSHQKRRS